MIAKFRRNFKWKPKVPLQLVLGLILLLGQQALAQNITVTGRVTGANNEPLSGASVTVKGTSNGTTTNGAGTYTLSAGSNATLVFSSVGYGAVEQAVAGRTTIDVSLTAASANLEQIVVVGYGTSRRRDVTGSVASVQGSEIARQPVQTATQAIQGKVAGVQIISSGEPNSLPTVRLRGTGSVLAGANPLYVVDGVLTDDIRNINSADILTMDILKDASATAIYGVRGANGVIIITTKKGRPGKNVFNYTGSAGLKEATNLVDMAGEKQYAGYLNEANNYYGSGADLISPGLLQGYNTDWYDAILQRAFQQNHNLSMSGGSDKFVYFLSGGYLGDEGIQKNNKYNRFTIRSNNEYTFNAKLKFNSQISYSNGNYFGANFDAFSNAYRAAPYVPAKVGDKYGNTSLAGNVANPLLDIDKSYTKVNNSKLQGNFGIDLKPIRNLTLRTALNFDVDFTRGLQYGYKYISDTSTFVVGGGNQSRTTSSLIVGKNDATRLIWDNTATYTATIHKHSFTALAGFVAERYRLNTLTGTAADVPANQDQWYLSAATGTTSVSNGGDKRTRLSYLGRLNYAYDNRYLLTATFRADGSSNFGKTERYGYFPALAVGWNIANENFMSGQQLFDNLKLRASYGKKGNDNISSGAYIPAATQFLPYYFPSGSTPVSGIAFDQITDPNIRWEITKELDFGFDFAILKNRLTGTFDYYDKKTDNALINIGLPASAGDRDNQYLTNATTISNKGVELGLNWTDKINKDWTYGISGNIAHNKNQIEKLNGGQPILDGTVGSYRVTKTDNGQPIASYFLLQADGIFQTQDQINKSAQKDARAGDLIYKDLDGNGVINDDDRAFSGSYQPKFTYGVSGNLGYRNFDFSFGTYGTAGAKIYNGKKAARGVNQTTDNIEASVAKDRWTPNNPNTGVPRATLGTLPASTYFLEKGDFVRLNNITAGYTFKSGFLEKIKITSARIYITAQNPITITNYSGFTPEIQAGSTLTQGVDLGTYPSTRTYAIGVNVGF